MLKRIALSIRDWLAPFAAIAAELRIIRECYEMELASRNPPLIRVTEAPSKNDTMVSYQGDSDDPRSEVISDWTEE